MRVVTHLLPPLLLLLVACGDSRATLGSPDESRAQNVRPLAGLPWLEVGGSNHVLLSAGDYLSQPTEAAWYGPNGVKPTIGWYHLLPGVGRAQLHAMRLAGQQKVSMVLWSAHLGTYPGDVMGHVVRSDLGSLTAQHEANLRSWLADVEAEGFNEVQLRFATQGPTDPNHWFEWKEPEYQETWNFMVHARSVMESALSPSTRRVYDLGGELGGLIEMGQNRAFTKRLWSNWVSNFGIGDTVGFSFATYPGRLEKMIAVYDEVGVRPNQWAFDTYDNVEPWMGAVAQEFAVAGIVNPSLYVQETYCDDEATAAAWARVVASTGLQIRTLMQWPVRPGAAAHFSMDFAESYTAYLQPRFPASVPAPTLSEGGVSTGGSLAVWLLGSAFSPAARVDVFSTSGALVQRVMSPNTGVAADGRLVLTFYAEPLAEAAFGAAGIDVVVVNPNGAASAAVHLQAVGVPPPPAPPTPSISNAGTGCDDNFCLWILGADFAADSTVELRSPGGPSLALITALNRSADGTVITLRLETQGLRDALVATGLSVRVLNGSSASGWQQVNFP